jgi:phosphoglycerate dehydrogenase-like enzyme
MVRVAVSASIEADVRSMIEDAPAAEATPDTARIELLAVDEEGGGADLRGADAAIRWDLTEQGFQRLLAEAAGLRWLHSPGAGVESWPLDELRRRGIVLTNAAGIYAIPIAEWVISAMLSVVKGTHEFRAAQREHRWATDVAMDELYGKTLVLLGTGGIAEQTALRAAAFGMRIWAANRSGRAVEWAERTVSADAWKELLPEADFVVSTVPATRDTIKMISADELKRFKPGAWLLNVGRGSTIDEAALVPALQNRVLGGAALDVWATEPLPADHPAWDLPNVIVSPHSSGNSAAGRDRSLRLFVDNLVRFAAGRPLDNVVDLSAGY